MICGRRSTAGSRADSQSIVRQPPMPTSGFERDVRRAERAEGEGRASPWPGKACQSGRRRGRGENDKPRLGSPGPSSHAASASERLCRAPTPGSLPPRPRATRAAAIRILTCGLARPTIPHLGWSRSSLDADRNRLLPIIIAQATSPVSTLSWPGGPPPATYERVPIGSSWRL